MRHSLRMLQYLVQVDAAGKQTDWINNTGRRGAVFNAFPLCSAAFKTPEKSEWGNNDCN